MLNRAWSPEAGGPVRSFSRSHFGKHIVLFPSQKNNKQIICESRLEADYCVFLEFDRNVKSYFQQPVTAHLGTGRKKTYYTPDFFIRTYDHFDYFAEVKHSFSHCLPAYLETLQRFEKLAITLKYDFYRIESSNIQQRPMSDTMQTLYLRSLHTTPLEYAYLINEISNKTTLTLRELLNQTGAPSMKAIAKAVLQGKIWIDLNKPINLNTTLWFGSDHEN